MINTEKIGKVTLATLGACNNVMTIFIPIGVSILWVSQLEYIGLSGSILLTVGLASSFFRGFKVWLD